MSSIVDGVKNKLAPMQKVGLQGNHNRYSNIKRRKLKKKISWMLVDHKCISLSPPPNSLYLKEVKMNPEMKKRAHVITFSSIELL